MDCTGDIIIIIIMYVCHQAL